MQLQMGVSYSWNNPKNAVWLQHFCVDCNYWMILMQPWSKFRSYLSPNYISILTCYWMPAHSCRYTYTHTHTSGTVALSWKIHWQQWKANIANSLAPSLSLPFSFSQHLSVCLCISVLHRVPLVATLCGILFIYVMLALLSFCIYKIHTQTHRHTQSTHRTLSTQHKHM